MRLRGRDVDVRALRVDVITPLTLAWIALYFVPGVKSLNAFYALCGLLGFATGYWAVFVTIASYIECCSAPGGARWSMPAIPVKPADSAARAEATRRSNDIRICGR